MDDVLPCKQGKWDRYLLRAPIFLNKFNIIFARTETKMFFDFVWNKADTLLFIEGRLFFHYIDGTKNNSIKLK